MWSNWNLYLFLVEMKNNPVTLECYSPFLKQFNPRLPGERERLGGGHRATAEDVKIARTKP